MNRVLDRLWIGSNRDLDGTTPLPSLGFCAVVEGGAVPMEVARHMDRDLFDLDVEAYSPILPFQPTPMLLKELHPDRPVVVGGLARDHRHRARRLRCYRTFAEGEWRVDRSGWNEGLTEVTSRGSLTGVADAHMLLPGPAKWVEVLPLIEQAFNGDDLAWVKEYAEQRNIR